MLTSAAPACLGYTSQWLGEDNKLTTLVGPRSLNSVAIYIAPQKTYLDSNKNTTQLRSAPRLTCEADRLGAKLQIAAYDRGDLAPPQYITPPHGTSPTRLIVVYANTFLLGLYMRAS